MLLAGNCELKKKQKEWGDVMQVFGLSNQGKVRPENQDCIQIAYNDHDFLAVVCDGIGGGKAGDVASALACEIIVKDFMENPDLSSDEFVKKWLFETTAHCNDGIFEKSKTSKKYFGMGTTMVGVLIHENRTYIFNIGDSRAYAMYEGFVCLTQDHNFMHELINSGSMSVEDASNHPKRNALTNALGIWEKVRVDVEVINPAYSILMLCSDGLYGYVSEEMIVDVLTTNQSCEAKVNQLIQLALQAGGYDNISVILMTKEDEAHA